MVNLKKLLLVAFAILLKLSSIAQANNVVNTVEKSGFVRSQGKIYVVMIIVITILAGLLLYVFRLDKKISKLEKGINS